MAIKKPEATKPSPVNPNPNASTKVWLFSLLLTLQYGAQPLISKRCTRFAFSTFLFSIFLLLFFLFTSSLLIPINYWKPGINIVVLEDRLLHYLGFNSELCTADDMMALKLFVALEKIICFDIEELELFCLGFFLGGGGLRK